MFRRFMILCWVITVVPVMTALVGWGGYLYYDSKVKAAEASWRLANESSLNEKEEEAADSGEAERDSNGQIDFAAIIEEARKRKKLGPPVDTPERERREIFADAAALGTIWAGLMLTFIGLIRTVRWVVFGRWAVRPMSESKGK